MIYNIRHDKNLEINSVVKLYESVGWTNYISSIGLFPRMLAGSLDVISVWDDDLLIALLRTIGDGVSIIYIQDILVSPTYQRQGIGQYLVSLILEKYKEVRQIVLLTDNTDTQRYFYESVGFIEVGKKNCVAFMK